jgi:hypothetical protein
MNSCFPLAEQVMIAQTLMNYLDAMLHPFWKITCLNAEPVCWEIFIYFPGWMVILHLQINNIFPQISF